MFQVTATTDEAKEWTVRMSADFVKGTKTKQDIEMLKRVEFKKKETVAKDTVAAKKVAAKKTTDFNLSRAELNRELELYGTPSCVWYNSAKVTQSRVGKPNPEGLRRSNKLAAA